MRRSLFLLIFPLLIVVYIALKHPFYFLLYPYSAINPYVYYQYSPGFWAVDIAFWIFSPLMYLKFRKNGESRLLSLLYMFCLDASSVGIFLTFFSVVYGIAIFNSAYYIYAFVLVFLFLVPFDHIKISWINGVLLMVFPVVAFVWKSLTPGNVGYFLSSSVVIDMSMIVYCFYWNAKLIDAIPKGGDIKWTRKLSPS